MTVIKLSDKLVLDTLMLLTRASRNQWRNGKAFTLLLEDFKFYCKSYRELKIDLGQLNWLCS